MTSRLSLRTFVEEAEDNAREGAGVVGSEFDDDAGARAERPVHEVEVESVLALEAEGVIIRDVSLGVRNQRSSDLPSPLGLVPNFITIEVVPLDGTPTQIITVTVMRAAGG